MKDILNKKNFTYRYTIVLLWIAIGTLGRLIPHIPNVTPLTSLSLLAGAWLPRRIASVFIIGTAILSDVLLAYLYSYPVFGSWTIFTYTGFLVITLFGSLLSKNMRWLTAIIFVSISVMGFWLWTNFGTWLLSDMYPHNVTGLITCYIAALPFLRNAVIGSLIWMTLLLTGLRLTSPHSWTFYKFQLGVIYYIVSYVLSSILGLYFIVFKTFNTAYKFLFLLR